MEKVNLLVSRIAPSICFTGRRPFSLAIYHTWRMLSACSHDELLLTKDIYPVVARQLHRSLQATERSIYRAAAACWMDGRNQELNQIIGRTLPMKPKPSELILYCAYYLEYGVPYHQVTSGDSLPLPF